MEIAHAGAIDGCARTTGTRRRTGAHYAPSATAPSATAPWWPTDCPVYVHWYGLLYPNRCSRARFSETEQFQILCTIYHKLNVTINTSIFTTALAQTCWAMKENKCTLAVA